MAEYVTPDDETAEQMRARLAEAQSDGRDRHTAEPAVPSATRYSGPSDDETYAAFCEAARQHGGPLIVLPASAPDSRARTLGWPLLALSASVAVQIAQSVVQGPEALSGLSEPVQHAVLSTAQVVLVLAAIYRMGPVR